MPKRIFIRDGGLTASEPTPTGYTVIGSENGQPKKQVQSTISNLVTAPLSTFSINAENSKAIYDLSAGNFASIVIQTAFKDVILPEQSDNLYALTLRSNTPLMNDVTIDINKYQSLTNLSLLMYTGKLNFIENYLELPNLVTITRFVGFTAATYSIQNCVTLYNIGQISGSCSTFYLTNNPELVGANFPNDSDNAVQNIVLQDNPVMTSISGPPSTLASFSITNCPSLISVSFDSSDYPNTTMTTFNSLVGNTVVNNIEIVFFTNLTTVDISGMTSLLSLNFAACALDVSSIENILTNLDSFGLSGGQIYIQAGTNAGYSTWTSNAITAYNNLISKSWSINYNP